MRAIIAFCLIAICLAATNENQSFFSKVLSKAQEIKGEMVDDIASLKSSTFDPKKILAETIKLAKDLVHVNGENTESVFGEDSFKTVQRVYNLNKKIIGTVVNTANKVKKSISNNMLVAKTNQGEHTHHGEHAYHGEHSFPTHKVLSPSRTAAPIVSKVNIRAEIAALMLNAESSFGEEVLNKLHTVSTKTKQALHNTVTTVANHNATKAIVNATHNAVNATKNLINATVTKVAQSNVTKTVVNATKTAVNVTATVAKAALNKTSSFIRSLVSHNMLNAEEKHTLAQKIAEKSQALLNKAKATASNLKYKFMGGENGEHSFGEHVLAHAKTGVQKSGAAVQKAAQATKHTLANVWTKLAGL